MQVFCAFTVCTGNVSRVRSRFESGGSTTTTSMSNQPRVATPTSLSTSSTANHHQTLPKTFKLRETLNPVSTFESRIYSSPSNGLNRFGGSVMHLNDNLSNKPRFTGLPSVTARQVYQPLDQATRYRFSLNNFCSDRFKKLHSFGNLKDVR